MDTTQLARFMNLGKKIVGVGLNYRALLIERNLQAPPNPVIFLKPTSSYIAEGQSIEIPEGFVVNQETELGVVVGKTCRNITEEEARKSIGGYCLALDMTEVKHLATWRQQGMPWSLSKGFDTSCPVSRFVSCSELPDPENVNLWCKVNGKMCQTGNTSDMLFSVATVMSYVSKIMTLEPGDLILTGSPPGMIDVKAGDVIEAGLGDVLSMKFPIVDRK
ncbi:acylpyruvase FAHD1, mitochondrial [Neocloeon triangulifer]|uniref:acylpyruvase FAHD1, mitochondrial n=1 Tax=Neocloeon triangulifer TaxID=2078957 RepID=UPI00286F3720|nr:acylpyruvase FAHD1, mitochondrial [Neocloeon triangulifer]